MSPELRKKIVPLIDAVVILGIAALVTRPLWNRQPQTVVPEFARAVDLAPLSAVAVQWNGRLKSFDSYARSIMSMISGARQVNGQSAAFTYLDLMLRPERYQDTDLIYVKKKQIRQRIAERLANDPQVGGQRLAQFQENGLIAPALLVRPAVVDLLEDLSRDVIRTSKSVDAIQGALGWSGSRALSGNLRIIPPPGGDSQDPWFAADALRGAGVPQDAVHAGMSTGMANIPGLDPQLNAELSSTWNGLAGAWRGQNPHEASAAVARLADLLPRVSPALYPSQEKLAWESWYFRYKGLVWAWVVYLLAIVLLLMATIYHWPRARLAGLVLFLGAFGLHSAALGIRWYLAGRIPNSNMYEAIMAATWFGGVVALVLEVVVRKTPMKNLFCLGAAACAMTAMMCGHFMPVTLNPDIGNIMPVLHDVWLYIHTNVIIASYCLIGMAAVTALFYLRYRLGGGGKEYAKAGGAGNLILSGAPGNPFLKSRGQTGQVLDGATMVLMELSFVLLWAGLVMGAIWADHSWGRPWGWDPKEVFALNTFIIFLILVHVRLKVRDKALWTALLACTGCGVMLFNWIVVNFVITGLHSYA